MSAIEVAHGHFARFDWFGQVECELGFEHLKLDGCLNWGEGFQ